jgi:hypothetical protein
MALGPLAGALNGGHVYVTLNRLEKAGLVVSTRIPQGDRPDRKVYDLTAGLTVAVMMVVIALTVPGRRSSQ